MIQFDRAPNRNINLLRLLYHLKTEYFNTQAISESGCGGGGGLTDL
jgi:hypothetical protein